MAKVYPPAPDGYKYVFTAYITQPDGSRLYAKQCGKRAFCILVKE